MPGQVGARRCFNFSSALQQCYSHKKLGRRHCKQSNVTIPPEITMECRILQCGVSLTGSSRQVPDVIARRASASRIAAPEQCTVYHERVARARCINLPTSILNTTIETFKVIFEVVSYGISGIDSKVVDRIWRIFESDLEIMKVLVDDKVVCVGENEPTVEVENAKLTREELNRGCPLGVSRVTGAVYVCGAHALPGAVKALRPGLVVSAAPELPPPPEDYVPRHYVPLLDTPNSDMHPFMERVADLINEVVTNGEVVLVHCVAGVSRSVTLCLAYLVKWHKMTLRDAYVHLKQRRPQIRPNTGFFKQMIKYEERLFGEASVKMVYCEAIDKEIPDVYEPDYRGMTWFRQRYGPIEKS